MTSGSSSEEYIVQNCGISLSVLCLDHQTTCVCFLKGSFAVHTGVQERHFCGS